MKADDGFLKEQFKEIQAQMRFTSEVEFRLLQYLLLFYPIVGLIFTTLYGSPIDSKIFLYLCIAVSIILIAIIIPIHIKICAEHRKYRDLGEYTQQIWKYFRLTERGAYLDDDIILPEKVLGKKGFGTGTGYIKTLLILWTISIVFAGFILALGILRNTSTAPLEPDTSAINLLQAISYT